MSPGIGVGVGLPFVHLRRRGVAAPTATVLRLPGTSGNYASAPDSAPLSVTGDLEIQALIAPTSWAAAGGIVSKQSAAYWCRINADGTLTVTRDGVKDFTSSAPTGLSAGALQWVKFEVDVDDGGGGSLARIYLGGSDSTPAWSQLGTDITHGSTISFADNSSALILGARFNGSFMMAGDIHRLIIKDGIDGTTVFDFDPNVAEPGASTVTEQANDATVTLTGTAELVSVPCPFRDDPDAPEFGLSWMHLWYADSLALSDSDPVASWADEVSGVQFTQATESARPTFVATDANFGGRATLSLDGGDGLAINPWSSKPSLPYTAVVVARIPHAASPTRQMVLYGDPPLIGKEDSGSGADSNKSLQDHRDGGGGEYGAVLPETAYVHIVVFDGPTSVSDGPNGVVPFAAGTDAPGGILQISPSAGRVTGNVAFVGYIDSALTAGQRESLRTLLESHYGIS